MQSLLFFFNLKGEKEVKDIIMMALPIACMVLFVVLYVRLSSKFRDLKIVNDIIKDDNAYYKDAYCRLLDAWTKCNNELERTGNVWEESNNLCKDMLEDLKNLQDENKELQEVNKALQEGTKFYRNVIKDMYDICTTTADKVEKLEAICPVNGAPCNECLPGAPCAVEKEED